jgi:uncharacterized membrane protein (UPF0136 family)
VNTSLILFVWGAIVALIGIFGYVTKHSAASLVAGVVAGALLIAAGMLLKSGKDFGFWLGVVVTVLLLGRFAPVYFKSGDIWPAGVMALLSLLALVGVFVTRRA